LTSAGVSCDCRGIPDGPGASFGLRPPCNRMEMIMKRCAIFFVCALLWTTWAQAQDSGPNLRQSIVYFMTFFNESTTQLSRTKEFLEQEKKDPKHPYTEAYLLYTDLSDRIERSMTLSLDLCDLYFIYSRATYCFAKEEKSYLLSRIDSISSVLQQLIDKPFAVATDSRTGDKAKMQDEKAAFLDRVQKLRALLKSSLPAIER